MDRESEEAKVINLQCKKGYLLDDMDRYSVYGPLCEVIGYDENTCPNDRIMSWSACQIFGYVCKFCFNFLKRGWGLSKGVSIHSAAELFFGMFMKA